MNYSTYELNIKFMLANASIDKTFHADFAFQATDCF